MLGPVKFVIDNYPKVFKTVSSLETNFIHGDDSMSVSFDSGSMKHHVVSFLNPCSAAPGCTRIAETHPTAAPGCTRE